MLQTRPWMRVLAGHLLAFSLLHCAAAPTNTDASSDASAADAAPEAAVIRTPRCEPHTVWCVDEQATTLRFQADPATGLINNMPLMGGAILSNIDARIGGRNNTESYIYAKFTDTGLEKVLINDDEAITSTEWDIAFQRSIIRLNSGASGPSCVDATEAPIGANWDAVRSVAADTAFRSESYFTPMMCNYMSDAINRPGTLLSSYYSLGSCLRMTHVVQLIHLRDGRKLKLEVLSYYSPDVQMACDGGEQLEMNQPTAGELRIRWQYLPE